MTSFNPEQMRYLEGFAAGAGVARASRGGWSLPQLANTAAPQTPHAVVTVGPGGAIAAAREGAFTPPEEVHLAAQDRAIASGGKLTNEEKAKRGKNALDLWPELEARAQRGEFPKGTDVFLTKYHGLFYVAPAQDSYMCRLRLPAGLLSTHQARGIADLAQRLAGAYVDVTTRANLQLREIKAADGPALLTGLQDLGVVCKGSGADNVRNITASPTAGFDPGEWFDTRPLARAMHHHILNRRELYGLPRKFNIAFDGGGRVSALADTNDIAFTAVRVTDDQASPELPAGLWFRMALGGITGHKDFARDAGLMLRPEQCVPMADAVLRVYIDHGDRTDRRRARLKYLLDAWGHDKFVSECLARLPFAPVRASPDRCQWPAPANPLAHLGVHPQRQTGLHYLGVVLPVGRITCEQLRSLADIADQHGSGELRLTVWQNLLIPGVGDAHVPEAVARLRAVGLDVSASNVRAGLVACTGKRGCRFAASNTKAHALRIAQHLDERFKLDIPVNIHLTGCHHSCAQHYIGDIGLLGAQVTQGEDTVEGYHLYIGGGSGDRRAVARELARNVPADEAPYLIERLLLAYLAGRTGPDESFHAYAARHSPEQLLSSTQQAVA